MFKRRFLSILAVVAMLTLSFGAQAMAANKNMPTSGSVKLTNAEVTPFTVNQIDKIMSFDYAGDSLTPEQLEYLAKDPELASQRAEKDVKFLIDKAEKQMNDSMKKDTESDVSILTVTIPIGQDTTVSNCEVGNKDGSRSGLSDWAANYSTSGKWSDVSTWCVGVGDSNAWSWVGPRVYISGSGSRTANIIFRGRYYGGIYGGYGGSSSGRIRVSVYDYTLDSEISGLPLWDQTASSGTRKVASSSSFSNAVQVTLQAGHTYAFRFGDAVASSQFSLPSPQLSNTDFWNDDAGGDGLDATSVTVDFI